MGCKWYNVCPLREFEKRGTLDKRWAEKYCKSESNWENCRRYQLEEQGIAHADNMLPDGQIDETLQ
jgi:hypothetical protein